MCIAQANRVRLGPPGPWIYRPRFVVSQIHWRVWLVIRYLDIIAGTAQFAGKPTTRHLNLCQDCNILPCIMFRRSSRCEPRHRLKVRASIERWRNSRCKLRHHSFATRQSPLGCVGGILGCCAFDMWQRICSPSPSLSSSSSSAEQHQSINSRA